VIRDDFLGIR